MLKKEEFISSIGYDGMAAIVDKTRRTKNKDKDIHALLQEGAFRSAAALALFNKSNEEMQLVADEYNKRCGAGYTLDQIPRLFGIAPVEVTKTLVL